MEQLIEQAKRKVRRPRAPEPVSEDVRRLIQLVKSSDSGVVQKWFYRTLNKAIDDELEALSVHFNSEWDPELEVDRVRVFIAAGQSRRAFNAVVAQVRKEVVAEIRANLRRESDDFVDACIEE